MMVVVIAAVLLGVGLPSLQNTLKTGRVRTSATDMHLALLMARSEAIKRNSDVILDAGGTDWSGGWNVTGLVDTDNDPATDPVRTILTTQEALPNITVECNLDSDTAADTCPSTVTFKRTGRPTSLIEFRLYVSDDVKVKTRCVSVSLSGRPRIEVDSDFNSADGC